VGWNILNPINLDGVIGAGKDYQQSQKEEEGRPRWQRHLFTGLVRGARKASVQEGAKQEGDPEKAGKRNVETTFSITRKQIGNTVSSTCAVIFGRERERGGGGKAVSVNIGTRREGRETLPGACSNGSLQQEYRLRLPGNRERLSSRKQRTKRRGEDGRITLGKVRSRTDKRDGTASYYKGVHSREKRSRRQKGSDGGGEKTSDHF